MLGLRSLLQGLARLHALGRLSMTRRALPWLRSTPPGSVTVIRAVTPITLLMWLPSSTAEMRRSAQRHCLDQHLQLIKPLEPLQLQRRNLRTRGKFNRFEIFAARR